VELFFFWVAFAIIVGVAANARGRSGVGWFLLSLLISPLLTGLLVLALKDISVDPGMDDTPSPETHVRCPDCRELVRMDAIKCKHCGTTLIPQKP
jgi:hypothetical protein